MSFFIKNGAKERQVRRRKELPWKNNLSYRELGQSRASEVQKMAPIDNKPLSIEDGAIKRQVWGRKELLLKTIFFIGTSAKGRASKEQKLNGIGQ